MIHITLAGPSTPQLRALYESAACFVFPSFYEGFGLPPLEAMACGCPVVASNVAAIPEVLGDAALYFDPANDRDIFEKVRRVLEDPQLRKEMREKGLSRARKWTWEKCAKETFEIFKEIAA